MKIVKKILNTLITILIVLVLIVSVLVAVMSLTSKSSGISNFFGNTVQIIQSDSMKGGSAEYKNDGFEKGDIIIGKATEFDSTRTYAVGDIITYKGVLKGNEDKGEQLICHRIVKVDEVNGIPVYQTWGDNRNVAQLPDQPDDAVMSWIQAGQIGAVFHTSSYDGTVIGGLGSALDFVKSQLGFFLCVLLPMIVFFLYELIRVVFKVVDYQRSKEDEKRNQLSADSVSPASAPLPTQDAATAPASAPSAQMDAEQFEQFKQFMAFQNMQKAYQQTAQPAEQSENTDKSATETTAKTADSSDDNLTEN